MGRVVWSALTAGIVASLGLASAAQPPGLPMAGGQVGLGDAIRVENLTVFPIYGREQVGLAEVVSLEEAQAAGEVKVRERDEQGSVGTLVVDNRGSHPVLVLAGTVIKGGKQDRQIGQDVVVAAGKSVAVDAFCVEHGRWSGRRQGVTTGGQFQVASVLAPHKVRAAGQYEKNQGKVWAEVGSVNAANSKQAETGTLMATYDDAQLLARRDAMTREVERALSTVPHAGAAVGLAYAVSGRIRGGRWFAVPQLYAQHRRQLVHTAVMEALTAQAQSTSTGAAVTAEAVRDFVSALRRASVTEARKTESLNENRVRRTKAGYSSEAIIEQEGRDLALTVDVLAAD